ncbi:hypothetical protein LINPERHAP1_LOCUS13722 [Linum perenne]
MEAPNLLLTICSWFFFFFFEFFPPGDSLPPTSSSSATVSSSRRPGDSSSSSLAISHVVRYSESRLCLGFGGKTEIIDYKRKKRIELMKLNTNELATTTVSKLVDS